MDDLTLRQASVPLHLEREIATELKYITEGFFYDRKKN